MNEELKNKKCIPCEGGIPPLTEEQAKGLLSQVSDRWNLENLLPENETANVPRAGVVNKIWAEFKFKNFIESMSFVNKVGELAESEGHHPDIDISYSRVKLELWTHAIGGLSENDFILAAKIDEIA